MVDMFWANLAADCPSAVSMLMYFTIFSLTTDLPHWQPSFAMRVLELSSVYIECWCERRSFLLRTHVCDFIVGKKTTSIPSLAMPVSVYGQKNHFSFHRRLDKTSQWTTGWSGCCRCRFRAICVHVGNRSLQCIEDCCLRRPLSARDDLR